MLFCQCQTGLASTAKAFYVIYHLHLYFNSTLLKIAVFLRDLLLCDTCLVQTVFTKELPMNSYKEIKGNNGISFRIGDLNLYTWHKGDNKYQNNKCVMMLVLMLTAIMSVFPNSFIYIRPYTPKHWDGGRKLRQ